MNQARRKASGRSSGHRGKAHHGPGMLIAGMIIGSLATIMWQGMQTSDGGVGAGIREIIEQSKEKDQPPAPARRAEAEGKPVEQKTNFDFFTVLPEIEVVVTDDEPVRVPETSEDGAIVTAEEIEVSADSSAYMLQAGSYRNKPDAERLKAELAFQGHPSKIQKVTIEGRGDFYRVRLGPFPSHDEMAAVDDSLASSGIKSLRLKISKGG